MTRGRRKNKDGKSGEASKQSKPDAKTPQALKPEPKIVKKPPVQGRSEKVNNEDQHKGIGASEKKENKSALKNEGKEKNNKEKLGGMIFMCNQTTKPDCYRYKVMGLPENKQDLVMKINPGLKLFLYDFDTKLLYGVYKASSAGGMKLEPSAFKGSYPAQVRFEVHKDYAPMADSVFKKAIRDNYDVKRNWFKMELTVEQVNKLIELFRSPPRLESDTITIAATHQAPILLAPPRPMIPMEAPLLLRPDFLSRGPHVPVPTPREDGPRDLLSLSEKEYRTFGLKPPPSAPMPVPAARTVDSSHATKELGYTYGSLSDRYAPAAGRAPYPSQVDYQTDPSRRRVEEAAYKLQPLVEQSSASVPHHLSNSYGIPRRGEVDYGRHADEFGRLHSSYAGSAFSDGNQIYQLPGSRADQGSLPVSSRYSFAGPTFPYR